MIIYMANQNNEFVTSSNDHECHSDYKCFGLPPQYTIQKHGNEHPNSGKGASNICYNG